jgi:hypothetical protein
MHNFMNVFTYRWLAIFTGFAALILHLDNAKAPLVWAFVSLTVFLLIAEIHLLSKKICDLERVAADRTINDSLEDIRRSMWQQTDAIHERIDNCSNSCSKAKTRL